MRSKPRFHFFVLLVTFCCCSFVTSIAQTVITGTVTSSAGEALQGVNILVKGTAAGAATDVKGAYTIRVDNAATAVLVFSFSGYGAMEMKLAGNTTLHVTLTPLPNTLDQVVVVGYGTQKQVHLTGSVVVLPKEALTNRPVTQLSQALQGQLPGVTVIQTFDLPGRDGGTTRIRGIGTLGNNDALVLVDGVPSGLNEINTNDVENISILKDAAAASIYGSRAANGVILVTTKRGKKNEPMSVTYNTLVTVQQATDLPDLVDGLTFMQLRNEENKNNNTAQPYSQLFMDRYRDSVGTEPYFNTNWFDAAMNKTALQHIHTISVRGGGEKLSTYVSVSYLDQNALIDNSDFKRYTMRFNTNLQVNKKLSFQFDGVLRREVADSANGNGTGSRPLFRMMYEIPAIYPAIWKDGFFGEGWNGANPLAYIRERGNVKAIGSRIQLNLRATYNFTDWLGADIVFSPKYITNFSDARVKKYDFRRLDRTTGIYPTEPNQLTLSNNRTVENYYFGTLRFNKTFGKHRTGLMGGLEYITNEGEGYGTSRQNYLLESYMTIISGDPNTKNNFESPLPSEWALFSQFARANYSYDNKYLFEVSIRHDGSSRFSSKYKQYGYFPAVSAGWVMSEEPYIKNISAITYLKIKGSWGQLGNQETGTIGGNYPSVSLINLNQPAYFGGVVVPGAAQTVIANEKITWETAEELNVGVEFGLLNNRLTGTFEVYKKNTRDILYQRDIPAVIGLTAAPQNIAEVQNNGWDLQLGWNDRINKVDYGITFVLSDVRNKVINLNGKPINNRNAIIEGEEYNAYYGYESTGIYRSASDTVGSPRLAGAGVGDLIYRDLNKDGKLDANDKTVIGSSIPRYNFGITLHAGYKGFDLSVFLQGVGMKDLYYVANAPNYGGTYSTYQYANRFVADDPAKVSGATLPRLLPASVTRNWEDNTTYLYDAAYLRVKNIALTYNVPDKMLQRIKVHGLRIFVSGVNLLTFDRLPINTLDPEAPATTNGAAFYPNIKSYTAGLDITF